MLPTVNHQKITKTLSLSQKEITFRPYTVRESKVIMHALQLGDKIQLIDAIKDVVSACTFDSIDIDSLPLVDIEWLLLQIKARSSGEILELRFVCKNEIEDKETGEITQCNNPIMVGINLENDITITNADYIQNTKSIQFTDEIGVIPKPILFKDYTKIIKEDDPINREILMKKLVIDSVYDKDQIYSDFTEQELDEFFDSLYEKDIQKLNEYIAQLPYIYHSHRIKCNKCGHEEEYEFVGIESFLA